MRIQWSLFVSEVQISFKLPSETLEAGVPAEEKMGKEENWEKFGCNQRNSTCGQQREEMGTGKHVGWVS